MSDFDKKKSSVNNNENYNKKVDHTDDDIYEIPDIVSNGKKSNKMEDRKDKKKKTDHTQKHMFENRLHHHRKEKEKSDILEELEFISEESVKDKSRMAEGKPISHEFVSKKKTLRRSVDAREAKKEKSVAFMRRNIAFVGIGCLVVVVGVSAAAIGVKNMKAKKAAANKNQALSAQEYETDQYAEINTLMENYYASYASGNTGEMLEFANPISDMEKSYISMYSQYIEKYNNITCYTKTGADDSSFIVIVAFDLKYKNVDTAAPGLDCFYVKTNEQGKYYIDNVYSPFNMSYQENPIDDTIRQLISKEICFAVMSAWHLAGWYRDNRFCGRCATPTIHSQKERMLYCPDCGNMIYPKIAPAVIIGVVDRDRLLLSKYAGREYKKYALLAGFTEFGETAEETVAREVFDEVGLHIGKPKYY